MGFEPTEQADLVCFAVYVQPRASRTAISGVHGNALKIQLAAPPVDGAANAALITFLADALKVSKSAVSIRNGHSGRSKLIEVRGIKAERVLALLTG